MRKISRKQTVEGTRGAKLFEGNVVIWVNGGSASASEIVAGALRDLIGAKLVGEKTFGKGEIQTIEPLSEGAVKGDSCRILDA